MPTPNLSKPPRDALMVRNLLATSSDACAAANVRAIVVQLDKALVNTGTHTTVAGRSPRPGAATPRANVRPPNATSYQNAADLLAGDLRDADTSKTTCTVDLALAIEQASGDSSVHHDAWRGFTACRRTDEANALAGQLGIH